MTPERFKRITDMLAQRQLDLTVCMEEVHKPHNLAAIVRTADAIGIHRVHAVWPKPGSTSARAPPAAARTGWM